MINLIPNEEKKKKVKDFYFRLTIIFFEVLAFSIMVASVALVPSYFMSSVKKNLINTMLESQKNEPTPLFDQETIALVDDIEKKLKLIEDTSENKYSVSLQVINQILLSKMSDIKINEITYDVNVDGKIISIKGTAPNRDRLLAFRRALEDNVSFKKVNLPISNFIKGSNIRFSLTLIPS